MYFKPHKKLFLDNDRSNSSGYTLPFVLLFLFLSTTLFLCLVQLLIYQEKDINKKIAKKKLDYACFSALQKILAEKNPSKIIEEHILINNIDVELSKFQYGFYNKLYAQAKNKFDSSLVSYTIAEIPSPRFKNALVFSKPNIRVTVAGNTIINGNILASTDNLSLGYIQGLGKTNKNFINGEIIVRSDIEVKKFKDSTITNYLNECENNEDYDEVISSDFELDNSFWGGNKIQQRLLVIGNLFIKGNITSFPADKQLFIRVKGLTYFTENVNSNAEISIFSDSSIIIKPNTTLENCLLMSISDIRIENESQIKNTQLISKRNIFITKSKVLYPSIACTWIDLADSASLDNRILISETNFNGNILLISSVVGHSSNKSRITVDEKSMIQGLVYCENDLEMLGNMTGVMYTYNLYFYKEPTEYKNWLVDLSVDRETLDENFLIPLGFNESPNYTVLKELWIH